MSVEGLTQGDSGNRAPNPGGVRQRANPPSCQRGTKTLLLMYTYQCQYGALFHQMIQSVLKFLRKQVTETISGVLLRVLIHAEKI